MLGSALVPQLWRAMARGEASDTEEYLSALSRLPRSWDARAATERPGACAKQVGGEGAEGCATGRASEPKEVVVQRGGCRRGGNVRGVQFRRLHIPIDYGPARARTSRDAGGRGGFAFVPGAGFRSRYSIPILRTGTWRAPAPVGRPRCVCGEAFRRE